MKTIIICPTHEMLSYGRSYVAVLDGKVVAGHFCSNDNFAKSDLTTEDRMERYKALCPDGFEIKFSDKIFEGRL